LVSKKSPLTRLVPFEHKIRGQAAPEGAQTLQEVVAAGFSSERKLPRPLDADFHLVARTQSERFRDNGGNTYGEAVAPFGDLHGSAPWIYSIGIVYPSPNPVNVAARASRLTPAWRRAPNRPANGRQERRGNMNLSAAAPVTAGAISARIDRLPATRTMWTMIALLGFGMFFELYDLLFTAYVAPSLVKSGVLTAKTAGLFGTTGVASFIAALFTGLFIGTILCGFLADRYGRRAIFTWSLIWYSAANIMVSVQTDAFGLNLWRLVSGIGLGVEMVTIGAYLSELAPKGFRGRAFAVNQAIGFTCVPIISFLAWLLVPTAPFGVEGWRWVVLIGALAAPIVVFLRRGLPESPRWLAKHGRLAEADRVLSAIEAKVAAEYGRPLPPPGPGEPVAPASRFLDLWLPGIRGRVILMSIFNIFQTVGFYGFSNWVPSLLVKQGITVSTSLGYTTVIALAAPVGPLIGFFLGDRFERKWIIVAAAFVILVAGLVFGQASTAALIIAMGVMLTLGNNIMSYSFHAYQQELFPTGIRARAAGFVYSWSRLSVIFSSFVIAFVLDAFGAPGVFVFIAAAMAVVMATIGIFGPRTTNLALEEIAR
jgi:MFS transporter, putative metabolite:H+ symporter